MALIIPTFPDEANYSIQVNLDGIQYLLTFRYSEREKSYFVDLALNDGTLLVAGKRVVCKISLFHRQRYNPLVPPGHVIAQPVTNGSDEPPDIGELGEGRRVILFYATKAEVGGY